MVDYQTLRWSAHRREFQAELVFQNFREAGTVRVALEIRIGDSLRRVFDREIDVSQTRLVSEWVMRRVRDGVGTLSDAELEMGSCGTRVSMASCYTCIAR